MIRLCKNLFYKPKYGSNADSIIMKHLFSTVTVVLVCLAAISFSAYAFFSLSVTSGINTIKSSSFSATVSVNPHVDPTTIYDNMEVYAFVPGTYTVTISTDSGTTGTGFCIVLVDDSKYYTQQLGRDITAPNQERPAVSFVLDVKAASTVTFETHWGTTSCYDSATESEFYIKDGPLKTIVVNGLESTANGSTESTPNESTPGETTPGETTSPTESTGTIPSQSVYTVAPNDTLAQIAFTHNTTYQRIAAFNNIDDPKVIYPGQEILIPPADWVMPEETTQPGKMSE